VAAAVALLGVTMALLYLYLGRQASPGAFEVQVAKITAGTSQAVVKLHNGKTIALADKANLGRQFEEANGASLYNTQGSLSYQAGQASGGELIFNEIFVPRAGEYRLTLSDGTKVWLNAETQLKYPVQFAAHERVVTLTGEAYFEVAPDTSRPFIVNTLYQGRIQVYGTKFNINAYAGSTPCLVTLNEGKVSVRKGEGQEQMLKPDQQAVLTGEGADIRIADVDAGQFSAWKDGMLVFDNLSFYDISTLLSRWYDVQFEFGDDEVKNYRFTADIKKYGSFRDVLRFFEKTNQLSFEIEGRTIRVTRRQKNKTGKRSDFEASKRFLFSFLK
jgi:transmembrane sensor